MRSPPCPSFECLQHWGLSYRLPPSLVQLWDLRSHKNHNLRLPRGHYQHHNRNRWCMVSCPPEISLSDSLWFPSGQGLQTSEIRALSDHEDEHTGTKAWHSPYDMSIHK